MTFMPWILTTVNNGSDQNSEREKSECVMDECRLKLLDQHIHIFNRNIEVPVIKSKPTTNKMKNRYPPVKITKISPFACIIL